MDTIYSLLQKIAEYLAIALVALAIVVGILIVLLVLPILIPLWVLLFICGTISNLIYGAPKPFRDYNRMDTAQLLDEFIRGDWSYTDLYDSFCDTKFDDQLIQQVANEWRAIEKTHPRRQGHSEYCSPEGWDRLRELKDMLTSEQL